MRKKGNRKEHRGGGISRENEESREGIEDVDKKMGHWAVIKGEE